MRTVRPLSLCAKAEFLYPIPAANSVNSAFNRCQAFLNAEGAEKVAEFAETYDRYSFSLSTEENKKPKIKKA